MHETSFCISLIWMFFYKLSNEKINIEEDDAIDHTNHLEKLVFFYDKSGMKWNSHWHKMHKYFSAPLNIYNLFSHLTNYEIDAQPITSIAQNIFR